MSFKLFFVTTYIICVICVTHSTVVDYKSLTWNMQGSGSSSGLNKWNRISKFVHDDNIEVLALQEVGPPETIPNSKELIDINIINPDGIKDDSIFSYKWNSGTLNRPKISYVYFMYMTQRCNIAIVSKQKADEVIVLKSSSSSCPSERPAIGIKLGNDYFFSIHAISNGGVNAPGLVKRIYDYLDDKSTSWMIMGDFNRESDSLMNNITRTLETERMGTQITPVKQFQPTQISGGNLDYAIEHALFRDNQVVTRLDREDARGSSDHYPILFTKAETSTTTPKQWGLLKLNLGTLSLGR